MCMILMDKSSINFSRKSTEKNFEYDVLIMIFEVTRYFYDQLDLLMIED